MIIDDHIAAKVEELLERIINPIISNHYVKNLQNWNGLCASLYLLNDLRRSKEDYYNLKKINHVEIVGIIQTLYIEQDCIETLKFAVNEEKKGKEFSLSDYSEIRNLRNMIFGHPSDKRDGRNISRHFFDITDSEHQIISHSSWINETGVSRKEYSIRELVEKNSGITLNYLVEIEKSLVHKFENIMSNYIVKFDHIFQNTNYVFEKLLTGEKDLAIGLFADFDNEIEKVKIGLQERNMFESFSKQIEVIEFFMQKLKPILYLQTSNDIEFYAYATVLRVNIWNLSHKLMEIDKI